MGPIWDDLLTVGTLKVCLCVAGLVCRASHSINLGLSTPHSFALLLKCLFIAGYMNNMGT